MATDFIRQQINDLLVEAAQAIRNSDWSLVRRRAQDILALDPENADAQSLVAAADRSLGQVLGDRGQGTRAGAQVTGDRGQGTGAGGAPSPHPLPAGEGASLLPLPLGEAGRRGEAPRTGEGEPGQPRSFVHGRYAVQRFLGEGGKKRVYLAHDTQLDRDVAFALLKSEGLDTDGLARIRREAQAMGRLGDHPHIVTVFDIGEENGQPYIVSQYMGGGSLQSVIEQAVDHRLPLEQALQIIDQVCQALEHAHAHGVIHRDLKPANVWLSGSPSPQPSPAGGGGVSSVPPQPSPARGEGVSSPPPVGEAGRRPAGPRAGEGAAVPTAALGDFGLAIALDRSRMTQAGMMLGTVSYMPPEQATGGEVTPRSDLYSLGAMLYEMVCGRPPFVGDDSVAIVSQHLNMPPVAPSWHVPNVSSGLEALILRLLEKDPTKRPGSAAEVRDALRGVWGLGFGGQDSARAAVPPSPNPQPPTPGPAYRRTFVGREAELRQLESAFDAALSGQGSLAAVVGEPGIGKTALCEQLSTYVAVRGGKTLIGHCYEEGSLSLPYLAFVEALRTYVLTQEPDRLKEQLGSAGGDVARIVSEVRERAHIEPRPAGGDPEEDRWRLLQGVTNFLKSASTVQPLLIVLEDLHWADRGTLDLLLHLSRDLAGSRLLVVGTYRDVEVERGHPLSNTLAELRRSTTFQRIQLRGLTVDEVHRMMNLIRGQEVPWSRAEAIHRQTEGNPLFVQEVLRYIVESGQIVREGDRYVRVDAGDPEAGIPEGLRDVIGKRLSRLSEKTNHVLAMAAVIGREFRVDLLQRVSGLSDDEIDTALEEATERAILEQRQVLGVLAFQFTHAFFRQTLYEEIFASRRLRLHQQVARGLEAIYAPGGRAGGGQQGSLPRSAARPAGRLEEHASELAEHFAQSTDSADLEKALHYSELAAQRSSSVFAYSEAVRQLERALQVHEVLDPDDHAHRCDLLLKLAEALMASGEPQRVAEQVAAEIFDLAETLSDQARTAAACRIALTALERHGGITARQTSAYRRWAERADQWALPQSIERVYADAALFFVWEGNLSAGHDYAVRALELARQIGTPEALFQGGRPAVNPNTPLGREEAYRAARELATAGRQGVDLFTLARTLYGVSTVLFNHADRNGADAVWRELEEMGARTRDSYVVLRGPFVASVRATVDGRLEDALAAAQDLLGRAEELGSEDFGHLWGRGLSFRPLQYLGRAEEFMREFGEPRFGSPGWLFYLRGLAASGRADECRQLIAAHLSEPDAYSATWALEAALLMGDAELASALAKRVAAWVPAEYLFNPENICASAGRLLGGAALLAGDLGGAQDYTSTAIAANERARFRPELALCRLQLAEVLLKQAEAAVPTPTPPHSNHSLLEGERGEGQAEELRTDAHSHLDFAIKEFESMKMQPSLDRARALRAAPAN